MTSDSNYTVSSQQKEQFAAIYLLEYMINAPKAFQLMLEREEEDLEPILEWLLVKDLIEIKDEESYLPTGKGRNALVRFMKRYSDFLSYFDVFCAVDLEEGAFAFAEYPDYDNPKAWKGYLNQERWDDLRITATSHLGIDPVEIVFMSFVNEGRFGRNGTGWQFDLLLGSVWDEILSICNTAIQVEQLGFESDDGFVSGESVIQDIVNQGFELAEQLHKQEAGLTDRPIVHEATDPPSGGAVEQVKILKSQSNQFADSSELPDHWKDSWEL